MGYYYGHGLGGLGSGMGFGFFGFFIMIIFGVLAIWAIIALMRGASGHGWGCHGERKNGEKTALDILKERYVKGEMSKEDFDKMKKDLE